MGKPYARFDEGGVTLDVFSIRGHEPTLPFLLIKYLYLITTFPIDFFNRKD